MAKKQSSTIEEKKSLDLTTVISTAIQIPGVKVSREIFLRELFQDIDADTISAIVEKGPVEAGITREELKRKANRIIKERTAISTGASFVAGIPGGWAMAATIPADMAQFYGVALRMAQELVYLYGEADMWCDGTPDADKVTNQLILYCGVMLGATGAAQTVRVMSSALAKQALKKLPQKALTKTFYYPVIKAIMRFFGVSVTKSSFSKVVSKAIPVVGGVVSGGITLASMLPMGNRLLNTLDKAHFDYSDQDFELDMKDIETIGEEYQQEYKNGSEKDNSNTNGIVEKGNSCAIGTDKDVFEEIKKAKELHEMGILTDEEYSQLKAKLISKV